MKTTTTTITSWHLRTRASDKSQHSLACAWCGVGMSEHFIVIFLEAILGHRLEKLIFYNKQTITRSFSHFFFLLSFSFTSSLAHNHLCTTTTTTTTTGTLKIERLWWAKRSHFSFFLILSPFRFNSIRVLLRYKWFCINCREFFLFFIIIMLAFWVCRNRLRLDKPLFLLASSLQMCVCLDCPLLIMHLLRFPSTAHWAFSLSFRIVYGSTNEKRMKQEVCRRWCENTQWDHMAIWYKIHSIQTVRIKHLKLNGFRFSPSSMVFFLLSENPTQFQFALSARAGTKKNRFDWQAHFFFLCI